MAARNRYDFTPPLAFGEAVVRRDDPGRRGEIVRIDGEYSVTVRWSDDVLETLAVALLRRPSLPPDRPADG